MAGTSPAQTLKVWHFWPRNLCVAKGFALAPSARIRQNQCEQSSVGTNSR
jgi:hypothetical protein